MPVHENESTTARMLSTRAFQRVEHGLYVALAILLCATTILALVSAAIAFWSGLRDVAGTNAVFIIIDRLLVVLMLVEIMHTVHVSVRSGALTCEPFLVVGLIACIRRVLVITLESSQATAHGEITDSGERLFRTSMVELSVLALLILVMVVSIYMLRRAPEPLPASKEEDGGEGAASEVPRASRSRATRSA
jgi:uncharacterized membrane protein (DUF373 family)